MSALEALLPLLPLERLPRTGWVLRGVPDPESIADHALGTALVALALGPRVVPALDVDRTVALAVLHDAPEALLGDWPRPGARHLPAGAKRAAEEGAADELLAPLSGAALERWREYGACETREARLARVCDGLHLGVRLVAYHRAGVRGLAEFVETVRALDCDGFEVCEGLRGEILAALAEAPPAV
jgi:putative hydrolase of HD superfamily